MSTAPGRLGPGKELLPTWTTAGSGAVALQLAFRVGIVVRQWNCSVRMPRSGRKMRVNVVAGSMPETSR